MAGDRDRLDRLLVNLIDNAVRYAKSSVTVAVRREDGGGPSSRSPTTGLASPTADLERAFDRFARLDDARSRDGDEAGGAGLGLAIVRATAQAYGGTAHLEGRPGAAAGAARRGPPARDVRLAAGAVRQSHWSRSTQGFHPAWILQRLFVHDMTSVIGHSSMEKWSSSCCKVSRSDCCD